MFTLKRKFLLFPALLTTLLSLPAMAEVHTETREERFSSSEVKELAVMNLAGSVSIKGTSGNEVIVKATISGEGRDAAAAREVANMLSLESRRSGDRVEILTRYPVDEYDDYVYNRGNGVGSIFGWGGSRTSTTYMGERVSVRSSGGGLAAHADYEVLVPEGVSVTFDNKVGDIRAEDVFGRLRLDTSSGGVAVKGGKGDVVADTGSGAIAISDREGEMYADTGSGSVDFRNIRGEVEADTGSGSVDATDIVGDVKADTGSGSVDLANITGSVWVDTGSGGVDGRNLQDVRELEIDTGSGGVELDGDFSKLERMMIDTGSGGVRMRTTGTLNMQLTASAGSGGVRVDLPGMSNVRTGRNELEAQIGDGKGRGVIDTGSGSIRVTGRD